MRLCNPKQKALGTIVYRLICFGTDLRSQIAPNLRIRNRLAGHVMLRGVFYLSASPENQGAYTRQLQQASCCLAPKYCRRVPTSVADSRSSGGTPLPRLAPRPCSSEMPEEPLTSAMVAAKQRGRISAGRSSHQTKPCPKRVRRSSDLRPALKSNLVF
jgi:hypothetical protein